MCGRRGRRVRRGSRQAVDSEPSEWRPACPVEPPAGRTASDAPGASTTYQASGKRITDFAWAVMCRAIKVASSERRDGGERRQMCRIASDGNPANVVRKAWRLVLGGVGGFLFGLFRLGGALLGLLLGGGFLLGGVLAKSHDHGRHRERHAERDCHQFLHLCGSPWRLTN